MKIYHACIFVPYAELQPVVNVWEKKCFSMLVVEHPADGKTKRIHCHILIETESGENWFRDEAKKIMSEFIKRGNYWIATRVQKGEHAGKMLDKHATIVYQLKGKYTPNFVKNITDQELEESRQAWVESDKADKTGDNTERIIVDIVKQFKIVNEPKYWRHEDEIEFGQCKYNLSLLWDVVRSTTWTYLWKSKRIAPHAAYYKIIACSVFMRICEDAKCDKHALGLIMEKWY